jgi:RimJ/RimL family protein N-acetyltransferase
MSPKHNQLLNMSEKNVTVVEEGIKRDVKFRARTLDDLLDTNGKFKDLDIREGISFPKRSKKFKFVPSSRLALPGDESDIVKIFKEVYLGKYPYREFEDESEILKMIEDPRFYWVVFKNGNGSIIGCIALEVDDDNKRGILHGLVFKMQYQGLVDLYKLFTAAFCSVLNIEKDILSVSCEVRSAHSKSQYMGKIVGFLPVAFLPNKDIFFDKEESEIIVILYREKALKELRSNKTVKLPFQALRSYYYASHKLDIGSFKVKNYTHIVYKEKRIAKNQEQFVKHREEDKFGNACVTFSFAHTKSFFRFFHNNYINNIERVTYEVSTKEELFIFLEKLVEYMKEHDIRYGDCFVSAYNPIHQAIFLKAGFEPYGYIPAYKYNKKEGILEDQVVFMYYNGEINLDRLKLIPETEELVRNIKPTWNLPK